MKNVISGTSATNVAAIADGACSSPQYASAYVTVLFPVVTVAVGAILAGELVSTQFVAGALLVMVGTYVGAFAGTAS